MGTSNYPNLHLQTLINPSFLRRHVSRMNFGGGSLVKSRHSREKGQDHIFSPVAYFLFTLFVLSNKWSCQEQSASQQATAEVEKIFYWTRMCFRMEKIMEKKIQVLDLETIFHDNPLWHTYPQVSYLFRLVISTDSYVILTVKQSLKRSFPMYQTDTHRLSFLLHFILKKKKISQMLRVFFHY